MIAAARVGFDLVLVAHILIALGAVVVLVALRVGADAARQPGGSERARTRFPDRVDWAARSVHLLPVSGFVLVATGSSRDGLSEPWVLTGFGLYLVLAGWLEARVLPAERTLARALAHDADVAVAANRFVRLLDGALVVIALALVTMVTQF